MSCSILSASDFISPPNRCPADCGMSSSALPVLVPSGGAPTPPRCTENICRSRKPRRIRIAHLRRHGNQGGVVDFPASDRFLRKILTGGPFGLVAHEDCGLR